MIISKVSAKQISIELNCSCTFTSILCHLKTLCPFRSELSINALLIVNLQKCFWFSAKGNGYNWWCNVNSFF